MTKPLSKTALFRAAYNAKALARLEKALPEIFPPSPLIRARARPYIPPMPRLAIDGYWRAHPIRADRLARALARKSEMPIGWTWQLSQKRNDGLPATFRTPPAPFREKAFARGPGHCCVCGQPVYKFGWHVDLWGTGPSKTASWHSACVTAWRFWAAPSDHVKLLRKLQARRCKTSGGRLWKTAEIDHRVPLFQVWREHRDAGWPNLLDYWGMPNLDVINRDVHAEKCASEAGYRALRRQSERSTAEV